MLTIMGVNVIPNEIAVTFVSQKFDGDIGVMNDEKTKMLLENLGASLVAAVK